MGQTHSHSAHQPGSPTPLTYFPFPFRERVPQSQEHGKVSVGAVPHLIAVPPFLNASLRLPLWQHLLTFLRQEARPGRAVPSCFRGLGFGEDSGRGGVSVSTSRAARLGLLLRAKTPCGPLAPAPSGCPRPSAEAPHPLPLIQCGVGS